MKTIKKSILCGLAAMLSALMPQQSLVAGEVTSGQARTAAENWVRLSPRRMGSVFRSCSAQTIDTVSNETGRAVFHAINFEGGGFVVTSGDTRLSPIVAFSTSGRYSGDRKSPLYALLLSQEDAVSAVREYDEMKLSANVSFQGAEQQNIPCLRNVDVSPFADAELEWAALLSSGLDGDDAGGSSGVRLDRETQEAISDVRVSPMLTTKWGQQGAWDCYGNYTPVYNYYSPVSQYPCGCTATAGAQIMYYYKAPSGSIAQFSNTCYVDGSPQTLSSLAGTFDWNNMFLEYIWWEGDPCPAPLPDPPALVQRQAVSKLTYNIGVAVGMKYTAGASSVGGNEFLYQLKSRFGYKSGSWIYYDIDTVNRLSDYDARVADFNNALYASLDAKMPVFLSLHGTGDHAVVADGYGYMSGTGYTHLNTGYEGDGDVWYKMVYPDVTVADVFGVVYQRFVGIGFNIHPTLVGDIVSGRVTNSSGSPVSGATVTLYDSSDNVVTTSTTDAKGIYSIRFTSAGSYKVKATSGGSSSSAVPVSLSRTVTQDRGLEFERGGRTGNKWGVNLTIGGSVATYTVTYKPGADGSGSQQTSTKTHDVALTLKGAIFTRSGYTQTGWSTRDGGTKVYDLGASYTANSATTLYPVWTQNAVTYTVTYKPGANGSGSQQTATKQQGIALVLRGAIFTRAGYTQTGWSTSDGGAKVYELNGYYTSNAAATFYPFWTKNESSGDAWDPGDDTATGGTWLTPTSSVQTHGPHTVSTSDEYDLFRISMTAGATYVFESTGSSDMFGELFSSSDLVDDVAYSDDDGDGSNFRIEYTPTTSQTYYLRVREYYSRDGSYSLKYSATGLSQTYRVTFGKNGGTGGDAYVTATYGKPMPTPRTAPTKDGYIFGGYWTTTGAGGVQYYDGSMKSVRNWDKTSDTTLWAKWEQAVSVRVTFGKNGGTGGDAYVTATYGKPMPTPRTAPTLSGYTFAGYWDTLATDANGNPTGKQYYDGNMKSVRNWDKKSATTLWAKWTNKVTFGKNGGTGGDSFVTVTKDQPMPKRTMPTKAGYFFDGYWTTTGTGGVKYYNSDGTSAHAWDKKGDTTLWAKWVKPVACKVTFGKNGGSGGDNYVTATSGQPMPTPRTAPTLSGWTFAGYWDTLAQDANGNPTGKQYYDKDMKSVRSWDKTSDATLWAKWTVRVKLGKNGGTGGDDYVTVTYNQPFPKRTMPTKSGYAFGGYFVSAPSKTGQCYNSNGTGTASMKWTTGGSPTVWALWTKTASCVELSASSVAEPASVMSAVDDVDENIAAGMFPCMFADGTGALWLLLDEPVGDADRTACLCILSDDDCRTVECAAYESGDFLLLTTEDGDMYVVDLAVGMVYRL